MRKYHVKNPFYLHGELQIAGSIVEITEDVYDTLQPKDVLGRAIESQQIDQGQSDKDDQAGVDWFKGLSAAEQKSELTRLQIDGDYSNEGKRVELYTAYLEGGADAQTETNSTAAGGASDEGSGQVTTEI